MSFDVFFQRFADGDAGSGGGENMLAVLEPFVVREEPEYNFLLIEYKDGTADVYLGADSMLANHISGREPWDLLVTGARAADWVILPVCCAACITIDTQRVHLPAGLDEEVVLVETGTDLLQVNRVVIVGPDRCDQRQLRMSLCDCFTYPQRVTSDDVTIRFTHDQALVLSDWLSEVMGTHAFDDLIGQDRAVWSPLHTLSGVLETTLVDIFSPESGRNLHDARQRLLDQLGDLGRPPLGEERDAESDGG